MNIRANIAVALVLSVAISGCKEAPGSAEGASGSGEQAVSAKPAAVEQAVKPANDEAAAAASRAVERKPTVQAAAKAVEAKAVVQVKSSNPTADAQAPAEQLAKVHTHRAAFNARSTSSLKRNTKLPDAAGVMCGQFPALLGKNTLACVTRTDKDGPWEKIIIDLNRNRDLTDDASYELPADKERKEIIIELNGNKAAFTATASQHRGQVNLVLGPTEYLTGSSALEGRDILWAGCDCNLSGRLDSGDKVYLDGDGNGSLTDRGKDPVLTLTAETALLMGDKWYTVVSSDGNNLQIGPYEGRMSRLTIDHSEITDKQDVKHDLRLYLQDRMVVLQGVDPAKGVEVPPSVVGYVAGSIKLDPRAVNYTVRKLNLNEDKLLKLTRPKSNLTVSQSGGKIHVNQRIVSEGGVSFSIARAKPGPAVEVYSEKNPDEPLTKGNMAYG